MTEMNQFTTNLANSDDSINETYDTFAKPAGMRARDGKTEVWARALSDGTLAVGFFNRGRAAAKVTAAWAELGLKGKQVVRDLWQQKDLGIFNESFSATVPERGAVMVKIGPAK
jgi:alpha-galactosidase